MEIKAIGCEPLSLKRVFIEDGHTLKVYQDTGGYRSLKTALGMAPGRWVGGARPGRGVPCPL